MNITPRTSTEIVDQKGNTVAIVHTELSEKEIRIYLHSVDSNRVEHKPIAYMLGTNCIIRKIK